MDWVKEKMHQARLHRIQIQKQEQFDTPAHQLQKNNTSRINRPVQSYDFIQKLVLLATGLISGAVIVIVLWSANLIDLGGDTEIDQLRSEVSGRSLQPAGELAENKAEVRGDEILTNTASELEILPSPAAGKTKLSTLAETNTNKLDTKTSSELQTNSAQTTVDDNIQPQASNRDSRTWVINLVSLQQKSDAEFFVEKAKTKGVPAEINQASVRGKTYWRVQVPGFSSADEAKTQASEVQNKLGLKNVWIVQR
jgi:cell division septation protein DedD